MLKTIEKTGQQQAVSKTVIKQFRNFFLDQILWDEQQASDIWPKKGKVVTIKLKTPDERKYEHIIIDKDNHFVNVDGIVVPDLRTVHKYPDIYPKFTVDQGAIKFILKGANVMAPGLINQHSHMEEVQEDRIVSIYVYGHQHAVGIGITKKSTALIRAEKQGLSVQLIHYAGDGFWNYLQKLNQ